MEQSNVIDEILKTPVADVKLSSIEHQAKIVDFIHEWLFFSHRVFGTRPEHSEEVLGARNVFVFPNGWTYTLPCDAPGVISSLTEEVREDDRTIEEIVGEVLNPDSWRFDKSINGWEYVEEEYEEDPAVTLTVLARLSALWGDPTLVMPFLELMERIESDPQHFLDQAAKSESQGDHESARSQRLIIRFLQSLTEGTAAQYIPWSIEFAYGSAYIPRYSTVGRIFGLADDLRSTGNWFVSLDEHCGSCLSTNSTQFIQEHPGLERFHEFVTWGQSSEEEYCPNGSANVRVQLTREGLADARPLLSKWGFGLPDHDEEGDEEHAGETDLKLSLGWNYYVFRDFSY